LSWLTHRSQRSSLCEAMQMGAKCCSQRKDKPGPPQPTKTKGDAKRSIKPGHNKRALSIGGTSDDAKKFDAAFEKSDIKAFVGLLSSTQPIADFEENIHPWAEDPRTVGALAATQLAIMTSSDENKAKAKIGKAVAIPPLVYFLDSKEKDRQQCAIVALGELLQDSSENIKAAVDAGAIEKLLKHKDSQISEARQLVANTLRNIFVEDDDYREEFVEKGGISFYIKQLNAAAGASDDTEAQLDAVLNLLDLLEDDKQQVIPEYVDDVKKAGVESKLQSMLHTDEDELKDSIEDLLEVIRGR